MSINRKPIFDFVRTLIDRPFTSGEITKLDAAISQAEGAAPRLSVGPHALGSSDAFFAAVRAAFGPLTQTQVEGYQKLLQAFGVAAWPISYAAYALATAYWETNKTMQPVREAYWLSEDWRRTHLRYYPWYGRGYVQLTWEKNYRKADAALDLKGELAHNQDLAMNPETAARIMVWGMSTGAFTGKSLSDFLPADGLASTEQFKAARQIINGHDKDDEIAAIARAMQGALSSGEWA